MSNPATQSVPTPTPTRYFPNAEGGCFVIWQGVHFTLPAERFVTMDVRTEPGVWAYGGPHTLARIG